MNDATWILIIGALAGGIGASVARGSLRMFIGAIVGAGVAYGLDYLRTVI